MTLSPADTEADSIGGADDASLGDDMPAGYVPRPVRRVRAGVVSQADDCIAEEVPVAISYNGVPHVVMMATPRDLEDFALGFSLSEAIVETAGEIAAIATRRVIEGIEIDLSVPPSRAVALESRKRNLTGRTSCGLCGAQALEDAVRQPDPVSAGVTIDPEILHRALSALGDRQPINAMTGATHAAAWALRDGTIACLREDVGRHNALDKLIGAMARAGIDSAGGFLVLTSRASYEMVQKAATAGIAIVAAISAPTALAIQLADATNVTLIGFARSEGHVVYSHASRVIIDASKEPT